MASTESTRVAVVAGGGSGIGRGCALRLARTGYRAILLGRTREKFERTAAEIRTAGGEAEIFVADVRDWDRLAELGASLAATGIDLLVNSAGGQKPRPSAELSREEWQAVVDTNLSGSSFLFHNLHDALAR